MKTNDGLRTAAKALGIDVEAESAEFGEVFARYVNTPQWMKAPNGKPSHLTVRQWIQVRTPAFKKKAGDWEAIIRKRQLERAPKATVAVGAFVLDEGQNAQQSAKKYFSTPVVKKTEIGGVTIDERSAKDSLAHGYGQRKLDVLATLQNDFDNAVYLNSRRDFDDKDVMNHYFAYPVSYNGEINYVFCRARQDINMNRLYVHEVFSEDEIEKAVPFKPLPNVHLKGLKPHGGTALYKNILQQILNANPHGVMADIDENGEPKIVQEGQFHE